MVLEKPGNAPVFEQFSLNGKVAIVTGGAGGLGVEAVRALAEAGADVALFYNTSKSAEDKAQAIANECHVKVKAYQCAITDRAKVQETVEKVAADFGRLDIMVANAGVTEWVDSLECTPEQFRNVMQVNVDGAFYCAQAAGTLFKRQNITGSIIFTASVSAHLVNLPQRQSSYNASKAAVLQLARCLAVEWVDFARVNCISPGFIKTDMISSTPDGWSEKWHSLVPANRFCEPYELKGAFVFLASRASSYMTGGELVIDGAYTLP